MHGRRLETPPFFLELKSGKMIKLLNNQIIVEPIHRDRVGNFFIPENSTDMRQYTSVMGIVKHLPENLVYSRNNPNSIHAKTHIELKVGDTVWYHFLCYAEAVNGIPEDEYRAGRSLPSVFIEFEGKQCLMLNYNDCYCLKRDNEVYALNGFVLAEPDEVQKTTKSGIVIPDNLQEPTGICTVLSLGHLIDEYKWGVETIIPPDDHTIKVGDKLLIPKFRGNMIEKFHEDIIPNKKLYFFQRRDALCKISGDKITPLSDRLLIKPDDTKTKIGKIYLPQSVDTRSNESRTGVVLASGIFAKIKEGCRVHYEHPYSSKVNIGGNEWVAVREKDVLYVEDHKSENFAQIN